MKNVRLMLILLLVAIIVIFTVQNAEELQVRFLLWSFSTRRAFVLFGVLGVGIVLGWSLRAHSDAKPKIANDRSDDN